MALVSSLGTVFFALAVNAFRPDLAPALLPILLMALASALLLAAFSLWSVRNEQSGRDEACRNIDCEFSSIFQNVLDGILILDNEANCLDVNPAGASILRVARNDLIGRNVNFVFAGPGVFSQNWKEFLQRGTSRGRAHLVAGDRTAIAVDYSGTANYLPHRHLFILCDVTEQIRAEKALRESEERFRHVADNIQEVIWRMNAETKEVVYVNQAYATITGHSVESIYRNPFSYRELIHPQDRIRILSRLHEAVVSGTFDEEFPFIHANGTIRWIWVKASLAPQCGRTHWLVGTAMDITARKQAEEQISQHLDAAEAARAEAEALRKATLALGQNLAMDSVLDTLLRCISELIPFDKATVLFVENGTELMVAREVPRTAAKRIGLTLSLSGNTFLQRVLFEKQAILLTDTAKESEWRSIQPLERIQSWLGIPLVAGGDVLGILSLGAASPSTFTTEHLRLAKSFAIPSAVAIQNARIHERAEIYAAERALRLGELKNAQNLLQQTTRKIVDPTSSCRS